MSLFPNFGTIYCVNNPFSTFFITVVKRLLQEFILTCTKYYTHAVCSNHNIRIQQA